MKTAIYVGLLTIAAAIKGTTVFDEQVSTDAIILSIIGAIIIACDIYDLVKNLSQINEK